MCGILEQLLNKLLSKLLNRLLNKFLIKLLQLLNGSLSNLLSNCIKNKFQTNCVTRVLKFLESEWVYNIGGFSKFFSPFFEFHYHVGSSF